MRRLNNLSRFLAMAMFVFYGAGHVAFADEHPADEKKTESSEDHEHPEKGAKKEGEHPQKNLKKGQKSTKKDRKKNQKNKKSDEEAKGESSSWNSEDVEKDLKTFIESERSRSQGVFSVKDEVLNHPRKLALDKIHTDKIVKLSDGTSFVCADFKDSSGDTVDVDFFMTPTPSGSVEKVSKIQIHKVNGNARYTYVESNGKWEQVRVN